MCEPKILEATVLPILLTLTLDLKFTQLRLKSEYDVEDWQCSQWYHNCPVSGQLADVFLFCIKLLYMTWA